MTVKYEKFLLNGVEYKTQLTQKWVNRKKWEEPNPYLLTSHIPGTIMQIEVKEGQEVQEGDVLLILQAMKMNNKLAAPFSGKIKKMCRPQERINISAFVFMIMAGIMNW